MTQGTDTGKDLWEPYEVQQAQGQGSACGLGQFQAQTQVGGEWIKSSPEEKDLGVLVCEKLSMTWLQCALEPRTPLCWAAPPEREQQVKGGDSAPLLCSGETPPAVLIQLWGSSTRGTWSCWSESRGGHGDAARAGAALLWSQAERAGLVQPGEQKAPKGKTLEHLPGPKGADEKPGEGLWTRACRDRTKGMALTCQRGHGDELLGRSCSL